MTTFDYLEHLLESRNGRGSPGTFSYLKALPEEVCRAIAERAQTMDYHKFCGSRYWLIIRNYVLTRDGKACRVCNAKENLRVHHRTYEHFGNEHIWTNDLTTLCSNCHKLFHINTPEHGGLRVSRLAPEHACASEATWTSESKVTSAPEARDSGPEA
jgi:5-methylcytosine-specific restriction endonuclease McrA